MINCPTALDGATGLRGVYPFNFEYYSNGTSFWNVKNHLTPADEDPPLTGCTPTTKFVKHLSGNSCAVYICVASAVVVTPVAVTNPIANYPIPPPCPSGTVLNQETMSTNFGGWIRREFAKAPDIVPGHVYRLRIDEDDGLGKGNVVWSDAPPERIFDAVRISPYPCDFVTLEQEKNYWDGKITVAPALTSWWNSVTPGTTPNGACTSIAISGGVGYKVGSSFESTVYGLSNPQPTCTIKK